MSELITLRDYERQCLQSALEACGWDYQKAAKRVGCSRSAFYAKLKRANIPTRRQREIAAAVAASHAQSAQGALPAGSAPGPSTVV